MWSRLGELPSSDEMEMFYTEHDFQVDLENLRVQLEISCRDKTSGVVGRERMGTAFPHKKLSGNGVPTREILRDIY